MERVLSNPRGYNQDYLAHDYYTCKINLQKRMNMYLVSIAGTLLQYVAMTHSQSIFIKPEVGRNIE